MKKYLYLAIAAVLSVAFAACGNENKPDNKKGAAQTITVGEVTSTTAAITVTPKDAAVPFVWSIMEKAAVAEEFGTNYDSLANYFIAYYKEKYQGYVDEMGADQLAKYGITDFTSLLTYFGLLVEGEDNYTFEDLDPDTEYLAFAFSYDAANEAVASKVTTATFKTQQVQKISFSITVSENDTAVFINPSTEDSYLASYIDKDTLAAYNYTADTYFAAYVDYCKQMAEAYAAYGITFDYFLGQGQMYLSKADLEAGHTYVLMAAAFQGSVQASDVATAEYRYTGSAAAEAWHAPALMQEAKNIKIEVPAKELRAGRRPFAL